MALRFVLREIRRIYVYHGRGDALCVDCATGPERRDRTEISCD